MDEGATLEMWCGATHRGFESHSLRHFLCSKNGERSRKASLHAFARKSSSLKSRRLFFTSSPKSLKPCLLVPPACPPQQILRRLMKFSLFGSMDDVDFTARLRRIRRKTKPHLSTAASAKVEGFASRFCLQKTFKKTPTNRGGFTASRNGGPATNRLRFRGIFSRKAMNTFAVNCIFVQCMNSLHLQKTLSALLLSGGR